MSDGRLPPTLVWIGRLVIFAVFLALWEYAAQRNWIEPLLIGRPSGIALYLWQGLFVNHSLFFDLGWTLRATAAAFLLGSGFGILVGMLFVASPTAEQLINPVMTALNSMPRIALAPLFLIWFGLGIGSKIAIGFSLTFFIVLTSTVAGGRGVNPDHVMLARTLGASATKIFVKFTLPSAVPVIFNGLRLGLIYSLLGVIAGELIASEHGLGQTLNQLAAEFKTNGVFAIIVLLSIVGSLMSWAMSLLEERLLRWR